MEFYENLSQYYEDIFPLTESKITLIKRYLPAGRHMLDIGCSTGEMAIQLAKEGYRVKGLDLSTEMIKDATTAAQDAGVVVDFAQGDMQKLKEIYVDKFDGILCFGNTIVHLTRLPEIKDFFQQVYDRLNSGGYFLFQIVNYDRVLQQKVSALPLIQNVEKDVTFHRSYQFVQGSGLINFNTRLVARGEETRHSITLYPLQSREIQMISVTAGFTRLELFGSFNGEKYEPDQSIPLVGIAYKE